MESVESCLLLVERKSWILLVFKFEDNGLGDIDNIGDIKFGIWFAPPFDLLDFNFYQFIELQQYHRLILMDMCQQ